MNHKKKKKKKVHINLATSPQTKQKEIQIVEKKPGSYATIDSRAKKSRPSPAVLETATS